jgi:hypothetical protein
MLFVGVSEVLKSKRTESLGKTKKAGKGQDAFVSSIFDQEGFMTPEKMNELNAKRYNLGK